MEKKKNARACKIKEHNLAQCHVCLNSKREREGERDRGKKRERWTDCWVEGDREGKAWGEEKHLRGGKGKS